jgi:hypothetical protein
MSELVTDLSVLLSRLESIERENRRLKQIGLVAIVLSTLMLLMGQAHPANQTVEAEKFILKDSNGIIRARLQLEPGDKPTLSLLDASGFPLVSLGAGKSPFLSLCQGKCESQVQIGAFHDDVFGLALYGKDRGPMHGLRASVGMVNGVPGFDLFSEDATEHALLDLQTTGPKFELGDTQGFSTVIGDSELELPRTGERRATSAASILLIGKDGKALWSAP